MTAAPHAAQRRKHVALVAAAAVLGLLVGRISDAAPRDRGPAASAAIAPSPSRDGAVLAALGYLRALRWDVLVDEQRRRRTLMRLATPEAVDSLDAELAAPAEALRGAVSEPPVVARPAVLGYRVVSWKQERATVSIWGMALFATGAYPAATQWSTSRVELVWSHERWLVAKVSSHGGPSPAAPMKQLVATARAHREVRHVP